MDRRFLLVAGYAAEHHMVISLDQLRRFGVTKRLLAGWVDRGLLVKAGPHSYLIGGSEPTWHRSLAIAAADLGRAALIDGRAAARLHRLDGFDDDVVEMLLPRHSRARVTQGVVRSTSRPLARGDARTVDGLPVVSVERLILDAPLFRFSREEIERAIDSATRQRLVPQASLRRRALQLHQSGYRRSRMLMEALVDAGGESFLERRFLAMVRAAGLPRPVTQRSFRRGNAVAARVDFIFPSGLIVEVAGHATHSARAHRTHDAERSNELALQDHRVLTFTYEHVMHHEAYVIATLRAALGQSAA